MSSWHIHALRGTVGNWVVYPSLMTAKQIAARVLKSKDIRESKELDDYLQRDLKPRVKKIVTYLARRESHFFNSLLLGIFDAPPNWLEFDLSKASERLGITDLSDSEQSMGLLVFSGKEKIFAIDGQHRADAIRQAFELHKEKVEDDQYPVLFLGHVDTKEGRVRTKRLFCDINIHAVTVSKGDRVIINEDDLSAIVTRRTFSEYHPFKREKWVAVTEKPEQLEIEGSEPFTNLLALYSVTQKLRRLFRSVPGVAECDEKNVLAFKQVVFAFWDFMIKHDASLHGLFVRGNVSPAKEREKNRNLLFRPIGLELMARLYVHFAKRQKLDLFAWALGQLKWTNPGGVWDGIVWVSGKIHPKPKKQAVEIVLYILGELKEPAVRALQVQLAEMLRNDGYKLPQKLKLPALP